VDSALTWHGEIPRLRAPILVCAFRGWNDAAGAASAALAAVADAFDPQPLAEIDPEEYFDFQATRPTIELAEGQARRIEWPRNELIAVRVPGAERDLVLFDGTEPNLRWRTFSETVATAADALGVEMVITLGALVAEVSHTLPVPITGLASDEQLVEELDLQRSNYEGPTGIVGVVHDCCRRPQSEGGAGAAAAAGGADRDRRRRERAGGGGGDLRGADRPRRRRQPGDRRTGRADRGRAGRAAGGGRRRPAVSRHDRARVPAVLAAEARRVELAEAQLSAAGQISL
jgi:PAC2 family